MKNYLETLLEEKEIDLETSIDLEGHIGFTVQMVVDYICSTSKLDQKRTKEMLIRIDFRNGAIMDYIKFLAYRIVNI